MKTPEQYEIEIQGKFSYIANTLERLLNKIKEDSGFKILDREANKVYGIISSSLKDIHDKYSSSLIKDINFYEMTISDLDNLYLICEGINEEIKAIEDMKIKNVVETTKEKVEKTVEQAKGYISKNNLFWPIAAFVLSRFVLGMKTISSAAIGSAIYIFNNSKK